MKRFQIAIIPILASIAFVCSAPAQQAKLNRELSHLPPPVRKAIRAHVGDGKLESIDKDTDGGEVTYDVEMVREGKTRSFSVDGAGGLLDEEVFLNELPASVRQTIQKQVGAATLGEIDKSVEEGEVSYDVEMTLAGKTRNFTVGAKGALLDIEVFITELPQTLQTAIRKQAGTGQIEEIDKCFDDGEISYDVDVTGNNGSRTLSFDPDGELFSTEEDVSLSATPEAVQQQIKTFTGDGKLLGLSKITEDNEISYDVEVNDGATVKSASISPDGKILPDDDGK